MILERRAIFAIRVSLVVAVILAAPVLSHAVVSFPHTQHWNSYGDWTGYFDATTDWDLTGDSNTYDLGFKVKTCE